MDAPSAGDAPNTIIGQIATGITFGVALITFIATAISRFFSKRREARPDDIRHSDTLELIDSARMRSDLDRLVAAVCGGEGLPSGVVAKIDHVLDDLQHLKNEQEVARRAREEVARLLLEERTRQR